MPGPLSTSGRLRTVIVFILDIRRALLDCIVSWQHDNFRSPGLVQPGELRFRLMRADGLITCGTPEARMSNRSKRWPPSAWRELLALILPFIDAAPGIGPFSFGGGTALGESLHHRVSYDIDLFFESARALRTLSPQRNPALREAIGSRWQEPDH